MPHLHLSLSPAVGREPDLGQLAHELTDLTAQHLSKDPRLTAVRFSLLPATHWFIGARSLAADTHASYQLEIQVTAGSNSEAQIAAYLAGVHQAMEAALGLVHPTSYTVVQQIPAHAWGYGGRSQAERRLNSQAQQASQVQSA
ncbi:tautomerase family protein [Paucibacter sp. Y2R2-4]|uniref:tautomerase family protein n=1 Tax=Paucibacter sp. Y2R2-4 TaxID=2893553 RepID=UPI0021E3C4D8|nr:4-oxalocrotonate tautomerase [Paucibacter sp. Y2R2-4]MCV2351518.1 4-oxalocrotonate tautomerase [Paucibacter sp. Y2R2-4]